MIGETLILVVDSAAHDREALAAALRGQGCRVETAASAAESLAKAVELDPDLVLISLTTPGPDGLNVIRRFRADPRVAALPILVIVARDDQASRLAGFEAGADDWLGKPLDEAELRARIRLVARLNRPRKARETGPPSPPEQEPVHVDEWEWADPPLKERLQRDPAGVLKERGVNVPGGLPAPIIHDVIRIVSLLWVEGRILPLEKFHIDPADEGLLFGRGVWESTRTIDGIPWLWPLHIERLRRTAALLNIEVAPERLPDSKQVGDYVRALSSQDVIIRLNVTAGRPGKSGIVWMSASLRPQPMASIRLKTCPNPIEKAQPYLTWKTFQYATRLRVGQEAGRDGFDTALLLDSKGHLLEAAHANIFVRLGDGWATPTADGGLLPGTVRQHLLQNAPLPMREQPIPYALLGEVSEAFLTNSNIGLAPIARIDDHEFQTGGETLTLMRWLQPEPTTGPSFRFVGRGG